MARGYGDYAEASSIKTPGIRPAFFLTPVPAFPTVVIESAVTGEVTPVLSVEPVAVVFKIHAIAEVATPCGIIIVVITRIIPV